MGALHLFATRGATRPAPPSSATSRPRRTSSSATSAAASLLARGLEHEADWTATFARLINARSTCGDTPDLRAHVLAAAVTAALRVTIDAWLDSHADTDLPTLLATTLDLLAGGFEPV